MGFDVGWFVGTEVGFDVGFDVGWFEGLLVGYELGFEVGWYVGIAVGFDVEHFVFFFFQKGCLFVFCFGILCGRKKSKFQLWSSSQDPKTMGVSKRDKILLGRFQGKTINYMGA